MVQILKKKLKPVLGVNVNEIDTDILVEIIDNRILIIDSGECKLELKRLILSDTLCIWVKAMKLELSI